MSEMLTRRCHWLMWLAGAALMAAAGCHGAPGKPGLTPEYVRPEQVVDFTTLYQQNCVACHGDDKRNGAAISLANPAYLAVAGEANLMRVTAEGVPGRLMPGFAHSSGGMLTDEQIEILTAGMLGRWGKPADFAKQTLPAYRAVSKGNATAGKAAFDTYCARCHGADGSGDAQTHLGSIVDASYLGLISDQYLRSLVIAGMPSEGMPDWRSDLPGRAMTEAEITDVVAWLGGHRAQIPPPSSAPSTTILHPSGPKVTHEPTFIR